MCTTSAAITVQRRERSISILISVSVLYRILQWPRRLRTSSCTTNSAVLVYVARGGVEETEWVGCGRRRRRAGPGRAEGGPFPQPSQGGLREETRKGECLEGHPWLQKSANPGRAGVEAKGRRRSLRASKRQSWEGGREGGGRLPNRGVVEPSELLEAQGPGGRRLGTGHQRWRWRMDV